MNRSSLVFGLAGIGAIVVAVTVALLWKDIVREVDARKHVRRLIEDESYLLEIGTRKYGTAEFLAVERYVTRPDGNVRFFDRLVGAYQAGWSESQIPLSRFSFAEMSSSGHEIRFFSTTGGEHLCEIPVGLSEFHALHAGALEGETFVSDRFPAFRYGVRHGKLIMRSNVGSQ